MHLAEAAKDFAEDARAENTRRAYASDWADFSAWCTAAGVEALPAEAATVANYLTAKAAGGLAVSTLARRRAAIRFQHREHDLVPADTAELRRVWAGIQRRHGRPPRKKKALIIDELRRVVGQLPPTPTGDRDCAMLLIGFAGALRRSELAAIELDGPCSSGPVRLVFSAEGVEIHLGRSKGDKTGAGAVVGIPYGETDICPVRALERHLKASRIRSGPVFRTIDRWGHIGAGAVSAATASARVKAACAAAGLNPRVFAGHSLRRGMITSAHRAGVDQVELQRHVRHKNPATTQGYIEAADTFAVSLAGKVGL